jgi:hypothetical protein
MSDRTFAASLLHKAIELVPIRHGTAFAVWPRGSYKTLTPVERKLLRTHHSELVALARNKLTVLPDTEPDTIAAAVARLLAADTTAAADACTPKATSGDALIGEPGRASHVPRLAATSSAPETCPFCNRACVGPDHRWFRVLHWHDPAEVARRAQEATDLMRHQIGRD